jgi:outer membrane protein TolC
MKSNYFPLKTIVLFCCIFNSKSFAQRLKLETVIKSTKTFFPTILNSLDKIKESKASLEESEGAFDLNLSSEVDKRFEGYYDGGYFDLVLEKPLQYLNSKVYIGHRQSSNKFPIYEEKKETLDEGEYRVGVQLSLWRGRAIDPKRLKIKNSFLKLKQSKQDFIQKRNEVLKNASKSYWNWVAKGLIYQINEKLLLTMKEQQKAIKSKIAKGALARIYETETLQYIMKRNTLVMKSKQSFNEAALVLSLFLKDINGNPLIISHKNLPTTIDIDHQFDEKNFSKELNRVLKSNPKLSQLKLKDLELENNQLEAKNSLAPKIDLKIEIAKDSGQGDSSLRGEEQRVMLQINIPLERRLGNGKVEQIRAQRRILSRSNKLESDTLSMKLRTIYSQIKTYKEIIKNTTQEVSLSKKLQIAERKKFQQGSSDFFVVNLRDQDFASAQIKLVESHYFLGKAIADLKAITVNF